MSRVLEKMFWAMETERAPPRVLKKIASASEREVSMMVGEQGGGWGVGGEKMDILPVGKSFCGRTTWTATKGTWIEAPAPNPAMSW